MLFSLCLGWFFLLFAYILEIAALSEFCLPEKQDVVIKTYLLQLVWETFQYSEFFDSQTHLSCSKVINIWKVFKDIQELFSSCFQTHNFSEIECSWYVWFNRWQESFSRFKHIFYLDTRERQTDIQVYYIPGNHDIGYAYLCPHKPEVCNGFWSWLFYCWNNSNIRIDGGLFGCNMLWKHY